MKKILIALAAVCCCFLAAPLFQSCTESVEPEDAYYNFGFDSFSSSSASFLVDMAAVESTFKDAFRTELGIDCGEQNSFTYGGSVKNVENACKKAATELDKHVFQTTFVFVVKKTTTEGTTTVYTYSN